MSVDKRVTETRVRVHIEYEYYIDLCVRKCDIASMQARRVHRGELYHAIVTLSWIATLEDEGVVVDDV